VALSISLQLQLDSFDEYEMAIPSKAPIAEKWLHQIKM
jgi:hypothetical protein